MFTIFQVSSRTVSRDYSSMATTTGQVCNVLYDVQTVQYSFAVPVLFGRLRLPAFGIPSAPARTLISFNRFIKV